MLETLCYLLDLWKVQDVEVEIEDQRVDFFDFGQDVGDKVYTVPVNGVQAQVQDQLVERDRLDFVERKGRVCDHVEISSL